MPSNERIWLHDGEGRTPFDEPREHDECETSRVAGATRLDLAFQVQRQLFAQEEILGGQTRAGSEAESDELQKIERETEDGAGHHQCAMIPRINRAGIGADRRRIAPPLRAD